MSREDGVALEELEAAIAAVREREPQARLVGNSVGNLSVIDGGGEYAGWIDMAEGAAVTWVGQ